jgi:hypothetical protein
MSSPRLQLKKCMECDRWTSSFTCPICGTVQRVFEAESEWEDEHGVDESDVDPLDEIIVRCEVCNWEGEVDASRVSTVKGCVTLRVVER